MDTFYMVFWIIGNDVSRSEEIPSFDEAVDIAKSGKSGSRFDISFTDKYNPENDKLCLTGWVS